MVKTERPSDYDEPGNAPSKPIPPSDEGLRHITGVTPDEEARMEQAAQEEEGDTDEPTESDQAENNAVNNAGKKWDFSNAPKGPGRGPRIPIKKKGLAGFIIGLFFSSFVVFFQQGPNFVIQHIREQLLGMLPRIQSSHQLRYRRTRISRVRDLFTRDGRRGGKIISQMERSGWTFAFDGNDIVGVRPPGGGDFIQDDLIGAEINKYMIGKHPWRTAKWKTNRMEAFYSRYRVSRRSVIARVPDADAPDPVIEMRRRLASQVVPEEPDTRATAPEPGEDLGDDERADFDARSGDNRVLAESDGSLDDLRQKILNGDNLTPQEANLLGEFDQGLVDALYEVLDNRSIAGRAFDSIKSFASSTDILDKVCTMKNRLRAIEYAARYYRALSLLRYSSLFIGASDEIRKGELSEIDPELVNELFRRITELDGSGNPIGASPGFAFMLNGRYSQSRNEASSDHIRVDGVLSGVLAAINNGLNVIPGTSRGQCGVIQNPVFQVGVTVVEVVVSVFTGGSATAVREGAKQSARTAIVAALRSVISRRTAIEVAESALIDLTFEGALLTLQYYAERATSLNFTGRESGGQLGGILVAGGGTMNGRRSAMSGLTPATTEQYSHALDRFAHEQREENRQKSFFARTFDYHNYDSLTFKAANKLATMPYSVDGVGLGIHNGLNSAASIMARPLSIFSGMADILSAKAGAQPENEDEVRFGQYEVDGGDADGTQLATDPAGNLLYVMREDIANVDPEENVDFLVDSGDIDPNTHEPISDDFTSYVQNCIENVAVLSAIEDNDGDCLVTQSITRRYAAHMAWLDMLDGIDASLFPEEIGTVRAAGQ